MMTSKQQQRYYIKNTAYHEAGHAVVAASLGALEVEASVYPRLTSNPLHKPIGGVAKHYNFKLLKVGTTFKRCPLSKLERSAIGFAGVTADFLTSYLTANVNDLLDDFHDRLKQEELSTTDLENINTVHPSWRGRAVQKSLTILQANWPFVEQVAQLFIKNGVGRVHISNHMLTNPDDIPWHRSLDI